MWLLKNSPALLVDMYELTMAQVYFEKQRTDVGSFEIKIRKLPDDWGFFVMAGLKEVKDYLNALKFDEEDIDYLKSLGKFSDEFLDYLKDMKLNIKIRAMKEGTVFFPEEPILEVRGPIIHAQILESYILNILGFSIISASLGARLFLAAKGSAVVDFGLRRGQGPISALKAARGAMISGLKSTSNIFGAKVLGWKETGTMAHSFIQSGESEEQAFRDFADIYKENTIILVDTYDSKEGTKKAAKVAKEFLKKGIKLKGIRLDSGEILGLSKFAREYLDSQGLDFMQIFASGSMDEFRIKNLLDEGAPIDGFGVGTSFIVSKYSPAVDIVYKLVRYNERDVFKKSPKKEIKAGRKSVLRKVSDGYFSKDTVIPFEKKDEDLLQSFESAEDINIVQDRVKSQLATLPAGIKKIRKPASYIVEHKL